MDHDYDQQLVSRGLGLAQVVRLWSRGLQIARSFLILGRVLLLVR